MHDICLFRVLGVDSYDKAVKVANDSTYELCSEYRPVDNGIDVVREMNATDFMSIYLNRKVNNEDCINWLKEHELQEIYDNFNEEHIDNTEELEKFLGPDFAMCIFVDKIEIIEKDELYFKIHFDNYPAYSLWDYASVMDENECKESKLEFGKTSHLPRKALSKGIYNIVVVDAKKEKNEFGMLIPEYTGYRVSRKKVCLKRILKEYPIEENDYIVYLNAKY